MPKFSPASRMLAPWTRLRTKSGSCRHSLNRPCAEAGALDPLEPVARDDLVGVDVAAAQRGGGAGVGGEGVHGSGLRSVEGGQVGGRGQAADDGGGGGDLRADEVGAAAAALAPLEVAVAASRRCARPGARVSGFMPRHIEQPALRQSKPASVKTASRPSCSACSFTSIEPGTTIARTPSATRRPRRTSAAARRSSIRPLVQEPRKTVSTATSRSGVPAVRPM